LFEVVVVEAVAGVTALDHATWPHLKQGDCSRKGSSALFAKDLCDLELVKWYNGQGYF